MEKLEDRLDKAERELQNARLDWLDIYAKCKKLLGRAVKAEQRIEAAAEEETPASTDGPPVFSSLSPRAQLIQKQIMLRRRAMGGQPNGGGE